MKRIEDFRMYYNHTIHPELLRMERRRLRLIRLFVFSALLLVGVFLLEFYLDIWVLTLVLTIPIGLFIFYLAYRIQRFRNTFKPNIVNLVLDFIDDGMNYDVNYPLKYDPKGFIEKKRFLESQIFVTPAESYHGEDFITGKVGNLEFEMCELFVAATSPVLNGLQEVFKGVFLHATFPEEARGRIIVWPKLHRHRHFRAIRDFTWTGALDVSDEIMNPSFREAFLVYANSKTHVIGILSEPMQQAIVDFRNETGKEIYMSFINQEIYAAVTEDKDLLEPHIIRSNLSFELIREFFSDIHLLLKIAEDFDQKH